MTKVEAIERIARYLEIRDGVYRITIEADGLVLAYAYSTTPGIVQ